MEHADKNRELRLMQQTYHALMSVSKKLDKQDNMRFEGLTARQCVVILAIRNSPDGESSISNIAKKLDTTKQNVSQMIPVLEKKGYVDKSVSRDSKRTACVRVTEAGYNAMMLYIGTSAAFMSEVFADFTCCEMITMLRLLEKLHRYDGSDCSILENDAAGLFEGD